MEQTVEGPSKEARTYGMLCHLLALAGIIIPIPLVNLIGPLVIWLMKKDEFPFVNDHGRESVNFQITVLIAYVAAFVLSFVGIGLILIPVVAVYNIIMVIIATVRANDGEMYRYPVCIRLVK